MSQARPTPHVSSPDAYKKLYEESINDNGGFWDKQAKSLLSWHTPYSKVSTGTFKEGDIAWFLDGELNVSYNCVDRHALATPEKVALIWEADEPGNSQKITFATLLRQVCRCAGMLRRHGIVKGRY